jgi:hypothetical protein
MVKLYTLRIDGRSRPQGDKTMLPIIRIIIAGAILSGWTYLGPAKAAHIVPIGASNQTVNTAPAAENCCPLRAWPYIG